MSLLENQRVNDEEAILVEIVETLGEATQRLRAIRNRLRATGLEDRVNYRDLAHRVHSALAMRNRISEEAEQDVRSGETVVVLIAGLVMIALTVVLSWLFLGTRI